MRKLIFIICFFILASSAHGVIYRWVDEKGVVNFAGDYGKVPPDHRNEVEEVDTAKMGLLNPPGKITIGEQSGDMAGETPPIAQILIREGDFAVKLAEVLKIGQAKGEAEAESLLASAGILPKNGWIADYPVTTDVIGELQSAIGGAVDSGKIAMDKDQAIKALQDLTAQQGLPIWSDTGSQYNGTKSPIGPLPGDYGEYLRSDGIRDYYYDQGPPIVTYYPPPWDYNYLYAWVPYPFWYSGFRFRGFFILRDFHRVAFLNRRSMVFTNHMINPRTRGVVSIDPATRVTGNLSRTIANVSSTKRLTSPEAVRGAALIFDRSQGRVKLGKSIWSGASGATGRQISSNRSSNTSTYEGKVSTIRLPATNSWMGRSQAKTGSRNMGGSSFSRQGGFGNCSETGVSSSMDGRSFGGIHSGGSGFGSRGSSRGGGSRGRR